MFRKTYSANTINKRGIIKGCVYCSVYRWVGMHTVFEALLEVKKEHEDVHGEKLAIVDLRRI